MHSLNKTKILFFSFFLILLPNFAFGQNDVRISNMGPDGNTSYGVIGSVGVALNTSNNQYLVVWAASDDTGSLVVGEFEVYGQLIDAATGANIGSRIRLSDMGPDGDSSYAGGYAQVAYNSTDNEYLVVWSGSDDTGSLVANEFEIYGQRVSAAGSEIGVDFRISDMGPDGNTLYSAEFPKLAYNGTSNEYLVAWTGIDNVPGFDGSPQIYTQRINAMTGVEVGTNDLRVSDSIFLDFDAEFSLAFNSTDNEYLIAWTAHDTGLGLGEFEIYAQRLSGVDGLEVGANDFQISEVGPVGDVNYNSSSPSVAYSPDDNEYLVTWFADDNAGSLVDGENEIYGQFLDAASGAEVGVDDFRISDTGPDGSAAYPSGFPSVAYSDKNREYLVSWVGSDDIGSLVANEFEVFAQRINAITRLEIGENDFRVSDMGPDGSTSYSGGVNFSFNTFGHNAVWNESENDYFITWVGDDNVGTLVDNEYEVFGEQFEFAIPAPPSIPDLKASSDSGVLDTDNITTLLTPVVLGAAEADSTVTITSDIDGVVGVVVATGGVYELNLSTLSEGTHNITANALSTNSLQSIESSALILVIDQTAPIQPIITSPTNGQQFSVAPVVSGSAEANSRVNIFVNGALSGITAVADSLGNWSISASSLTSGTHNVVASSIDVAGIASLDSSSITFTVLANSIIDTDSDGIPDSLDPDDDNDGIDDVTEIADGTNSLDSGSGIERLGNEVCTEWNGFLSFLTQILELRNNSANPATVEISLFDINAVKQFSTGVVLPPQIQLDVIVNDLDGFAENTFGVVCATLLSGDDNALGGQLLTYQFVNGSYDIAFSSELIPSRTGNQFLIYNTFQPSVNFADASNQVFNWAQIVNDENTPQGGLLSLFDQSGALLETIPVGLGAKQRADIDIHRVGSFRTGLVKWEPSNSNAKFRIKQNRYFNGAGGLNDLVDAVSLSAKRGTGEKIVSIFDTSNKTSTLEIANVLDEAVNAQVRILNASGVLISDQTITLFPRQTTGYVINEILEDSLGSVTIEADKLSSLVVSRFEYGRSETGSLLYANPAYSVEPLRLVGNSSYNSFLGQNCRIRLANVSTNTESMSLSMTRFDGTMLLNSFSFNIVPEGTIELDLCVNETQQAYGAVSLQSGSNGVVFAETIRQNSEETIEVGNNLVPRIEN